MTEHHRLADKIDRAWKDLSEQAEAFIVHVEACLPPGRERWWEARPKKGNRPEKKNRSERESRPEKGSGPYKKSEPEACRKELKENLMFDVAPYHEALRRARRLDETWGGSRAERGLESSDSRLKFRAGQLLEKRKRYVDLLVRENRIRRKGNWDWYETVRNVRNAAWKSNLCPLVQINQLQAALQKEINEDVGFPREDGDNLGEVAIEKWAIHDRKPSYPLGSGEKWWENLSREGGEVEDAIWALYFSITSGDRVPGGPLDVGSKWAAPYNGTCVLRN